MHLTLSKISSMSDSSAQRETDQESLADWTLVDHEEESIEDDNGGEFDGENSPPEEEGEKEEEEEERETEEEEEEDDVVALGQKVEEVKVSEPKTPKVTNVTESSDVETLESSGDDLNYLHLPLPSNLGLRESFSSQLRQVGHPSSDADGDTESLNSETTSPESKLRKRRSRKPEATQDEETDLSLASCPSLPDDLPAIKPDSQYVHHPDKELNTRLNVIVALTIACVLGLGLGHFVGWSSRSLWEENLNAAQVRKLRELQDNLLSCMSTSPSSTDGVSPSLPPQCQSKLFTTSERPLLEDAHISVLHQNNPFPPQDNSLEKFFEPQDARVFLGPTPFFEGSFKHPSSVSEIPPGKRKYTSEALFYSVIPIQETRYDAFEAGRGMETTFEADPVPRALLTERLVDVIKPPAFPNRASLKPEGTRSFFQRGQDSSLKSDDPRIVPPSPGFLPPLDISGGFDDRFFPDVTTINIITDVEPEEVSSTGDDLLSDALKSTAAFERREKEFVSAMSPDFGPPVSSSIDVETSQGILVESIRSDASNKVRHIIYKDHRSTKDSPSPQRLDIFNDDVLAEESVTLYAFDRFDFKIEAPFGPSDEGSPSVKDQLEGEIWHTEEDHLYPSVPNDLDGEETLTIKKFPLHTREIQDVDSGPPFFADANALDDANYEQIMTFEDDNRPPYWIDASSEPLLSSEDYSAPLLEKGSVLQRLQSNGINVDVVSSWKRKHCATLMDTSSEEGWTIDDTSQAIESFDEDEIHLDFSETPHRYASPSTDFVLESLKTENALLEQRILTLQTKNLEPIRIKGREGREARALREHINLLITENEDMRLALGRHQFSTLPGADKAEFNKVAQDNHHLRTTVSQLKHLGPDLQKLQSSVKSLQNEHHALLVKVGKIRYEQPLPKELTPLLKHLEEMKLVVAQEAKKAKPPNSIYNAKSYITFMTQVISAFTNIHNFDEKSAIEKIDLAKDAFVSLFPKGFKVSGKLQNDILICQEHFGGLKKSIQQKWKQLKDLTKPEAIVGVGKSTVSKMNRVIVNVVNKVKEIAQSTIMNSNKQVESSIVSLSDNLNKLNQQFEEAWKSLEIRKGMRLDDTHFEDDDDLNDDEDDSNLDGDDSQTTGDGSDNADETPQPQPDAPLRRKPLPKPSPPASPQEKLLPKPSPPASAQEKPLPKPSPPASPQEKPLPKPSPLASAQEKPLPKPSPPASAQEKPLPKPSPPASMQEKPLPKPSSPASSQGKPLPKPSPPASAQEKPLPKPSPPASAQEKPLPKPSPPASAQEKPLPKPSPPASAQEKPLPKPSPPASAQEKPLPKPSPPKQTQRQAFQVKEEVQKQKNRKEEPNNVPKKLEETAPTPSTEVKGGRPSPPASERVRDAKVRQTKPREEKEKEEDKKSIQGRVGDRKEKSLKQDDSRYFKGQYNKFDKNKVDPTDLKSERDGEAEEEDENFDNKNERASSGLRRHWDKAQGKKSIFREEDAGARKQFIPRRGKKDSKEEKWERKGKWDKKRHEGRGEERGKRERDRSGGSENRREYPREGGNQKGRRKSASEKTPRRRHYGGDERPRGDSHFDRKKGQKHENRDGFHGDERPGRDHWRKDSQDFSRPKQNHKKQESGQLDREKRRH